MFVTSKEILSVSRFKLYSTIRFWRFNYVLCLFRPAESDFELYDLRKPLDKAAPVARDEVFSKALWETHFDADGRVLRVKELQDRIFGGGCAPELRIEVWPFLLGVYPWDTTIEERAIIMQEKHREYDVLKNQWESISPVQLKRLVFHYFFQCPYFFVNYFAG